MKKLISISSAVAFSILLPSAATAASFEESMDRCLNRNANPRDEATVMLSCTATAGKLSDCKVLSDTKPGKGFDKAALCVAAVLPMGTKTGEVKVPMKFPGGG
jgi:hypothetical protein